MTCQGRSLTAEEVADLLDRLSPDDLLAGDGLAVPMSAEVLRAAANRRNRGSFFPWSLLR